MNADAAVRLWIGRLPKGWVALPLKRVATIRNSNVDKKSYEDGTPVRLCNYTDVYYNDFITPDLNLMEATATPAEIHRFSLRRGDVIITKDSETPDDIAVPACVADDLPGVVCGYHLTLIRPTVGVMQGEFLFRCLQASGVRDQFCAAATGVTRFGLGVQDIGDALVPVPPATAQAAIAKYLDRKTAAIDSMISGLPRTLGAESGSLLVTMVCRLREYRQALITAAATGQIDVTKEAA